MRRMLRRVFLGWAALAWLVVVAPIVLACSVPVFRYALERWPPDAYEVLILHDGPLAERDQELLEAELTKLLGRRGRAERRWPASTPLDEGCGGGFPRA